MNVCVYGLWHLGSVTAACLAQAGHQVLGLDDDESTIAGLREGRAPIAEPGLNDLLAQGLESGRLSFSHDRAQAVRQASVVWIAFDTPVSEDDRADVGFVTSRVEALLPLLSPDTLVIISSQLPVGSARALERLELAKGTSFAALPENLRLGKAIEVFNNPDRVIAGVRNEKDRERISALLAPITSRIEWMSVESAEMTKHAINAFLAASVTFINEIATLCEEVGADAKQVERGLKSEQRIGPRAYLSPGGAFAGGTLARDITFLTELGARVGFEPSLIASVRVSNDQHKGWVARKLRSLFGDLKGRRVAVWGLTYKVGTNTLRRSSSIELCRWLHREGVSVVGHDPAVETLPAELEPVMSLAASATDAVSSADALVLVTEWPIYRDTALEPTSSLVVLDSNRFLSAELSEKPLIRYFTVGKG